MPTNSQQPRSFSPYLSTPSGLITGILPGTFNLQGIDFFQLPGVTTVTGLTGQGGGVGCAFFNLQTNLDGAALFDLSSFNSALESSSITFRTEDVQELRANTCRGVIITYRDMGPATLTVTMQGDTNSSSATIAIGTINGASNQVIQGIITNNLKQVLVPFTITDTLLALTITRPANGGNVVLTRVRLLMELNTSEIL